MFDICPTNVLMVGDTHGDIPWCRKMVRLAHRRNCDVVIQLGDFGYWPHMRTRAGKSHTGALFAEIYSACEATRVTHWLWLDGNHDDHHSLGPHRGHGEPQQMAPHIWHLPRGSRFTLGDVTFGTLGGATSIDAWLETTGYDFGSPPYQPDWNWFPDLEEPTDVDLERLVEPGPLDVLLTHEAPAHIDPGRSGLHGIYVPPEIELRAHCIRALIAEAVAHTTPQLVFHGHWHRRRITDATIAGHPHTVHGLGRNASSGNQGYCVLNLDTLAVG